MSSSKLDELAGDYERSLIIQAERVRKQQRRTLHDVGTVDMQKWADACAVELRQKRHKCLSAFFDS